MFYFFRLIKNYEEKFHHLNEKISSLERDLSKYRIGHPGVESETFHETDRKCVRNSQTSFKLAFSVETETQITEHNVPQSCYSANPTNEVRTEVCNCGVVCGNNLSRSKSTGCLSCKANYGRPNTLNIGLGFGENVSPVNTSSGSTCPSSANEIFEFDGYSYAKRDSELNTDCEPDEDRPNNGRPCQMAPPFDCTDGNGYLRFDGSSAGSDQSANGKEPQDGDNQPPYQNVDKLSFKELNKQYQEKDINEMSPSSQSDPALGAFSQSPARHKVTLYNCFVI